MLRVNAESAYPTVTPGPRVRVANYAPFLGDHAVSLQFSSHISAGEYEVLSGPRSRLSKAVVIARCATRVAHRSRSSDALLMVHRLLSLIPVPGHDPPASVDVYDFDDALFLGSISTENRSFHWLKREAERCNAHLRKAALVLAGNEYLASYAKGHAKRVEILPSCVDPSAQPLRRHREVGVLTVGWLGSVTTAPYLREILPVFDAINHRGVLMKLVTVGADRLPDEPWLEQHPWSLQSEPEVLASFDVGVMPMPDDPWARGKCGYKLLQYYAAGVPAIASPVGVNRVLLERGGGMPASSPSEWRSALEELAHDPVARQQAGLAGRKLVESEFSYQRWAPVLAELLRSVAG